MPGWGGTEVVPGSLQGGGRLLEQHGNGVYGKAVTGMEGAHLGYSIAPRPLPSPVDLVGQARLVTAGQRSCHSSGSGMRDELLPWDVGARHKCSSGKME